MVELDIIYIDFTIWIFDNENNSMQFRKIYSDDLANAVLDYWMHFWKYCTIGLLMFSHLIRLNTRCILI